MPQQYTNAAASPFRPWQPRANMAVAAQHPSNAWLLDSGATHHLTSDLHNMALHQPYFIDDSVLIGDGSGLSSLTLVSFLYPPLHATYA